MVRGSNCLGQERWWKRREEERQRHARPHPYGTRHTTATGSLVLHTWLGFVAEQDESGCVDVTVHEARIAKKKDGIWVSCRSLQTPARAATSARRARVLCIILHPQRVPAGWLAVWANEDLTP